VKRNTSYYFLDEVRRRVLKQYVMVYNIGYRDSRAASVSQGVTDSQIKPRVSKWGVKGTPDGSVIYDAQEGRILPAEGKKPGGKGRK